MKKITLFVSLVSICASAFAQRVNNLPKYSFGQQLMNPHAQASSKVIDPAHKNTRTHGTPFYTQTFGAGMPSDWTTQDNKGNAPAGFGWRLTHKLKPSAFNRPNFKSTSVADGYLIFPYDSLANLNGNPSPYPQYNYSITTGAIDCSTHPSAILRFQHYFESLNRGTAGKDQLRLSVSGDGGVTFVDYPVMHSLQANVVSPDPINEAINISDIAGGKSSVMIKFTYDGDYYWWAIDDITLEEVTTQDEKIEQYYYLDKGFNGTYKAIPHSQMPDTMYLQGAIFNAGYADQFVQLRGALLNSSKSVLATKDATGKTLKALTGGVTQAQARDTQYVALGIPSTKDVGTYYAAITTLQDADVDLTNNTDTLKFSITDTTFARDNGVQTNQVGTHSYTVTNGSEQGFEALNLFDIGKDAVATSVSLQFVPQETKVGSQLSLVIYSAADADTADVRQQNPKIISASPYTIKAGDTVSGKWTTIMLPNNSLLAANPYWVGFKCENNGDSIVVASDIKTVHNPNNVTAAIRATGGQGIFGYPGAPFIRLNMSKFGVGIAQPKSNSLFKLYQNQPNPFNGVTTINYTLANSAKVTIEVHDITGKKVMELNEGTKTAGNYSINIDGNKLGSGVYFYTLHAGDYKETLRMVVAE